MISPINATSVCPNLILCIFHLKNYLACFWEHLGRYLSLKSSESLILLFVNVYINEKENRNAEKEIQKQKKKSLQTNETNSYRRECKYTVPNPVSMTVGSQ